MNPLIIGTNGTVTCIEPATGQALWSTKLGGGGIFSTTGYEDVSVLLREGRAYAGCNGHLFALDAATGRILWHNDLPGHGHNDVSLAMDGVSVQFVQKTVRQS